jgi:hypothetical protein
MARPRDPKRQTIKIRAPKDLWGQVRQTLPGTSDQDLIRFMYGTSLIKLENDLKSKDFKDKLGRFLYGTNAWDRKIKQKR